MKTVFISTYNRPIYLWATLDSLYRATKSEVDFTIIDYGSTDPQVDMVIAGFERRGMISQVVRKAGNDPFLMQKLFTERFASLPDTFFYVESDVVIYEEDRCWSDRMLDFMDADNRLGMLGSQVDLADFVSAEQLQSVLGRDPSKEDLKSIKWFSSERKSEPVPAGAIAAPYSNPPGRLLALRKEALRDCPSMRDGVMHAYMQSGGWRTAITGAVRHRHLSLLNVFDYPEYVVDRDKFMRAEAAPVQPDEKTGAA